MLQNSGLGPQNEQYLISDEMFILLKHVRSCMIQSSHNIIVEDESTSSIWCHTDQKFVSSVLEKLDATSQKSEDLNCTIVKAENPTLMQSLYSVFSKE